LYYQKIAVNGYGITKAHSGPLTKGQHRLSKKLPVLIRWQWPPEWILADVNITKQVLRKTLSQLHEFLGESIKNYGKDLDMLIPMYSVIKAQGKLSEETERILPVLEIVAVIELSMIELNAYMRAQMLLEDDLLKQTYLVNINRVIAEAMKALFGYDKDEDVSLWKSFYTFYIIPDSSKHNLASQIEHDVKRLWGQHISWPDRNIATHFDRNVRKVAEKYFKISSEAKEVKKINTYCKLINQLILLVFPKYTIIKNLWFSHTAGVIDIIKLLDSYLAKDEKIRSCINEIYCYNTKQLKQYVKMAVGVDAGLKQIKKLGISIENESARFISEFTRIIALSEFLLNDIVAIIRAACYAESSWESRICLKRIHVSAYEIFNKIFGFNESSKMISCFQPVELVVNELNDVEVTAKLEALQKRVETIIRKYDLDNEDERNAFTHFRNAENIYLSTEFEYLNKLTLFDEIYFAIDTKRLFNEFLRYIVYLGQKYTTFQEEKTKKQISSYFDPIKVAIMQSTINDKEKEIQIQLLEDKFENLYRRSNMTVAHNKENAGLRCGPG
jgi:hypothetical protein